MLTYIYINHRTGSLDSINCQVWISSRLILCERRCHEKISIYPLPVRIQPFTRYRSIFTVRSCTKKPIKGRIRFHQQLKLEVGITLVSLQSVNSHGKMYPTIPFLIKSDFFPLCITSRKALIRINPYLVNDQIWTRSPCHFLDPRE